MFARTRSLGTIALAFMVLLSAFATPAMATISIDSETATDTSTSDVTGGETISFNVESGNITIETISDTGTAYMEIVDDSTGDVVYSAEMTAQSGTNHYEHVVEFSELDDAEVRAGADAAMTLKVYDGTDTSTAANTTAAFTLDNQNARSVYVVNSDRVDGEGTDDIGSLASEERWFGFLDDLEQADVDVNDAPISGNASSVEMQLADTDARDRFDAAVPEDAEDEDRLWGVTVKADGKFVPVFYQSAPSDFDDAYATYDDATGEVVFHTNEDEDFENDSNVDIYADNHMDLFEAFSAFGVMERLGF